VFYGATVSSLTTVLFW